MVEGFETQVRVLLVGDLLLDVYTKGKVERISPEAPVPILHVHSFERLPGGAGNVALNLKALGAEVSLFGRVGKDEAGRELLALLMEKGIDVQGVVIGKGVPTSVKNRFIAGGQQLIRTDYEVIQPLFPEEEGMILDALYKKLDEVDIVAISDYGKGCLTEEVLSFVIDEAGRRGIKVIIDPKGKNFAKYRGAYLIKPNTKEAYEAAHLSEAEPLDHAATILFHKTDMEYLLVTRSEKGMTLFSRDGGKEDFPVLQKEVLDVTGAGDTTLAALTYFEALGYPITESIELANAAASIAISKLGCVAVTLDQILSVVNR